MEIHFIFLAALAILSKTWAQVVMSYPPPLEYIPLSNSTNLSDNYLLASSLSPNGSDFPCKGLLGTRQHAAVAKWQAGGTYNFTLEGSTTDGGGSCQASISVDGAKSFYVMKSYIGNCPIASSPGDAFNFTLPADTPANPSAVFAWTWFNNMGSRDMYMNCAVVDIVSDTGNEPVDLNHPFLSRPTIFTANIGQGCKTAENADLAFPSPGPDVVTETDHSAPPLGDCSSPKAPSTNGSYPWPGTIVPPAASIAISGGSLSATYNTTLAASTSNGVCSSATSSAPHFVPTSSALNGISFNGTLSYKDSSATLRNTSTCTFSSAVVPASATTESGFATSTHTATSTEMLTAGVQPKSTASPSQSQPGSSMPSLANPILSTITSILTVTRTQYHPTNTVPPETIPVDPSTIVKTTLTISTVTITKSPSGISDGSSAESSSSSNIATTLTRPIVVPSPPETLSIPSSSSAAAQADTTGPTLSTKLPSTPTTLHTITRSVEPPIWGMALPPPASLVIRRFD